MRKRPMQNNFGGQKRHNHRPGGGHHHGHNHGGHNRPRKNYGAIREKCLAQARDAMAAGERSLAEGFMQYADHCWRMMMEENQNRPPRPQTAEAAPGENGMAAAEPVAEEMPVENTGALPAFITSPFSQPQAPQPPVDPTTIQNWEERDA